MNRRVFLKNSFLTGGALGLSYSSWSLSDKMQELVLKSADPLLKDDDETFWSLVRSQYSVSPNIINLNNGGVSPQPIPVQEAHIRYYKMSNEGPSYYMWRILDQGRESLRKRLGSFCGVSADELAINRNSTEGLNSVIFGLDLKKGDEVILSKYDYPNMVNAWKQREKREGIVLRWIEPSMPTTDDDQLVRAYENALTSRTKVVLLTHMVNWNGQLIPVRKVADRLRSKNKELFLISDSAHSFAQTEFNVGDLGCDAMATSLHKWLCAPFGTGLLWIRAGSISKVWALLSAVEPDGGDIRKFESLGTRSFGAEMAIGAALDFHEIIGTARKSKRLFDLKQYWMREASNIGRVRLYTPMEKSHSGALGVFGIDGIKAAEIEQHLFQKYGIHSVAIDYEDIHGVRITPNVYTNFADLDRLLEGIYELSKM